MDDAAQMVCVTAVSGQSMPPVENFLVAASEQRDRCPIKNHTPNQVGSFTDQLSVGVKPQIDWSVWRRCGG
jgi:hypothetical protein